MQTEARPEARLKAAVIDRLFSSAHVDQDSVLISEMVVENWARRADVVLANGKLWAFEIKSELDSLARLPGQIEVFSRSFEKFVVVVAAKFEDAARNLIPEGVGLWVEMADGSLRERARPKINILSKSAAIRMMTASELRRLLACNGSAGIAALPRSELERLASYLPSPDLANAARDAIKRRHRARHANFCDARSTTGTLSALTSLSRHGSHRPGATSEQPSMCMPLPPVAVPVDHPAMVIAPAGPVLRRIKR